MKPKKDSKQKQPAQRTIFYLDEDKKKNIAKYLIEKDKKLRVTLFLGSILFVSGIVAAVAYILVHFAINSWNISYVDGTPVRNYAAIIFTGLLYFGAGIIVSFVIKWITRMIAGKDIKDRSDEKLELTSSFLRYTYQTSKKKNKKIIVEVPLGSPVSTDITMGYEPKSCRIVFNGNMKVNYISLIDSEKKVTSDSVDQLVLYDYFDPSVHLLLKQLGFCFLEEGKKEDPEWFDD